MNHNNPQQQQQPPPPPPPSPPPECGTCSSKDRLILHNVRIKGVHSKLCTSCVLRLHPTLFCPHCFNLHDHPNSLSSSSPSSPSSFSNGRTLTCLRCCAIAHVKCINPGYPKTPYLCPPCNSTTFKFFDYRKPSKCLNRTQDDNSNSNDGNNNNSNQVIGKDAANALLAAAKISAMLMNKWAASVKAEADRKVKDAALAKKRAKEAIDHVMSLSAKFGNVRRKEPVSTSSMSSVPVRLERNGNGGGSGSNNNVIGCDNKNLVDKIVRNNVNGNGNDSVVPLPVPVSVVMPLPQLQSNGGGSNCNGNHGKESIVTVPVKQGK